MSYSAAAFWSTAKLREVGGAEIQKIVFQQSTCCIWTLLQAALLAKYMMAQWSNSWCSNLTIISSNPSTISHSLFGSLFLFVIFFCKCYICHLLVWGNRKIINHKWLGGQHPDISTWMSNLLIFGQLPSPLSPNAHTWTLSVGQGFLLENIVHFHFSGMGG